MKRLRPVSQEADGRLRVRLVALARRQGVKTQRGTRLPIASAPFDPPAQWQSMCDDIAAKGKVELSVRARELLWEAIRAYREYAEDEAHLPEINDGRAVIESIAENARRLLSQLKALDNFALLEPLLRSYLWPDPVEHRKNDWTSQGSSLVERYLHGDLINSRTLDPERLPILLRQLAEASEGLLADVGGAQRGRPGYVAFDAFISQLTAIYMGSKAIGAMEPPWRGKPRADASSTGTRRSPFVQFCRAAADLVPIRGEMGPAPASFGKAIDDRLKEKGIDRTDGLTRLIARDLVVDKHFELSLLPPGHLKREVAKNDAKTKNSRK